MLSFAEVLKRGPHAELDIHPDELEVGLQAVRLAGVPTHRIFLADALENGAGYASELGRPERLSAVLERILVDVAARFESVDHAEACDSSCPNCLRSWDNRRYHSALNWRLALDVAELATGRPMQTARWLSRGNRLAESFVQAFGSSLLGVAATSVEGLAALTLSDRSCAVLLGHPLWRREPQKLNGAQAEAFASLEDMGFGRIEVRDLYELERAPFSIYKALAG
jgi:DEAD/DEAH box helicase domain-containing protein